MSYCNFILFFHLGHILCLQIFSTSLCVYLWVRKIMFSALKSSGFINNKSCIAMQCRVPCSAGTGTSGGSCMYVACILLLCLSHFFFHSRHLHWALPVVSCACSLWRYWDPGRQVLMGNDSRSAQKCGGGFSKTFTEPLVLGRKPTAWWWQGHRTWWQCWPVAWCVCEGISRAGHMHGVIKICIEMLALGQSPQTVVAVGA